MHSRTQSIRNAATTSHAVAPKVALAHHWAVSMRGGEKVLEALCRMFPAADVYSLTHRPEHLSDLLRSRHFVTSAIDQFPRATRVYKQLLPIHPALVRSLQVSSDVDLVVSSDAALIKGLTIPDAARHVCYCHSPPRYLWEMSDQYGRRLSASRIGLAVAGKLLRRFDRTSADRVDTFVANSSFVRDRIRRYYDRDAVVVHPPVDVDDFCATRPRGDHFLVVSELTAYKRIDLAAAAFSRLNLPLTIIGDGPDRARVQDAATGRHVRLIGRQDWQTVRRHFETARGFVFPGVEDFGMTPVEAQAAGCPVIALRRGGALETVTEGRTGVFFEDQTVDSMCRGVMRFTRQNFDAADCVTDARRFRPALFERRMRKVLGLQSTVLPGAVPPPTMVASASVSPGSVPSGFATA